MRHSRFLLLAVGTVLGLFCAEMMLRCFKVGYGNAPLVSDPVLHHAHPKNYTYLAYAPSGEYGGFLVHYDSEGFASDPQGYSSNSGRAQARIAFMGDSFVEAGQVPFRSSFVGLVSELIKRNGIVKNYGVSSYSPVIYYLQWKTKVRSFKPTHVLMLLYTNDISDDQSYLKGGVFRQGELVAVPGPSSNTGIEFARHSYVVRLIRRLQLQLGWYFLHSDDERAVKVGDYVEENPDITPDTAAYVLRIQKDVVSTGGHFILMAVPSKRMMQSEAKSDASIPDFSSKWREWARLNSVEFLDLVNAFQKARNSGQSCFFREDIHFNQDGHRVVAREIEIRLGLAEGH